MDLLWKAAGAAAWGAVSFGGLLPSFTPEALEKTKQLCPHPASLFVAAFPYYAGRAPGNLALYCRGEDYHTVLNRRLNKVCQALQVRYPDRRFVPGTDNSPIPEQAAALLAGLGQRGLHHLLIVPPYGSYLFLGTILTDLPLENSPFAQKAVACTHCKACLRACPTGALSEHGFDFTRCLSHLSQKKGTLSHWEQEALSKSPLIWGCDLCQNACPCNLTAAHSPLPEFQENLLHSLSFADLDGLSNRQFREQYGQYAFSWRGPSVLRRNFQYQTDATEKGRP